MARLGRYVVQGFQACLRRGKPQGTQTRSWGHRCLLAQMLVRFHTLPKHGRCLFCYHDHTLYRFRSGTVPKPLEGEAAIYGRCGWTGLLLFVVHTITHSPNPYDKFDIRIPKARFAICRILFVPRRLSIHALDNFGDLPSRSRASAVGGLIGHADSQASFQTVARGHRTVSCIQRKVL